MRPHPGKVKAVSRRDGLAALGVSLACVALAFALVGRDLDRPGPNYDEVIQATPALDFLRGEGGPAPVPGARNVRWLGGWFPLMTQPYMGALKSQLLIGHFAGFGATTRSLRLATLSWACLGLALVVLWSWRALGAPTAVVAGLLLAVDPSLLFVARHDWGSFSLGLACRGGALLAFCAGWRRRSLPAMALGGLLVGLGLYNKIDFALFVGAGAVGLLLAHPSIAREMAGVRRREALAALGGALLGAAPMLIGLGGALAATRAVSRTQALHSPEWSEKLTALTTMLDGSYFERLMLAGGQFEWLGHVEGAVSGPLLWIAPAAAAFVALRGFAGRRGGGVPAVQVFVLVTGLATLAGAFAMPRAVRIHHFANALPFPQLVVAIAAVELWRLPARGARGAAMRATAALAVAACLAGALRVDLHTLDTIRESGGRGRWSDALPAFAHELEAESPAPVVVALDWGLAGPLHFTAPGLEIREPFWSMRGGRGVRLDGTPATVYLVAEPEYAVFPFGGRLLEALASLPEGAVAVRLHRDRGGGPAFRSIRFTRPHEVDYRGPHVEIRLR